MKLTDIKKNAEAKAAEARVKQEAAQRLRELDVHPLLKWKCDRNVRDAYFSGIVFAALANDLKIDDAERKVIDRIAASLQLAADERDEMAAAAQKTVKADVRAVEENPSEANPFSLLVACARELKGENVVRLFAAEYLKVCGAKSLEVEDAREQLSESVFSQTDVAFEPKLFKALCGYVVAGCEVQNEDLVVIADALGDDALRYLLLDSLGDVKDRLASARKSLAAKARAKKESVRLDRARAAFEAELDKIAEEYKDVASMPVDWQDDIEPRMAPFESSDIDWVESVNRQLADMSRISNCVHSWNVGQREARMRRKIVWKLVAMIWVAEKVVDPIIIDGLLRSAIQQASEGYNEKLQMFIGNAFDGIVELIMVRTKKNNSRLAERNS